MALLQAVPAGACCCVPGPAPRQEGVPGAALRTVTPEAALGAGSEGKTTGLHLHPRPKSSYQKCPGGNQQVGEERVHDTAGWLRARKPPE